ncbi:hypothetical protein Tco_0181584 [Tanacetum coccineum]
MSWREYLARVFGGIFLWDEDRRLYEEMQRLQALGKYTDDQIMVMVRKGKQRGHIPGVGQVLVGRGKDVLDVPVPRCNHNSDVNELKRNNMLLMNDCESGAGGDVESDNNEDTDEDEEDVDS